MSINIGIGLIKDVIGTVRQVLENNLIQIEAEGMKIIPSKALLKIILM